MEQNKGKLGGGGGQRGKLGVKRGMGAYGPYEREYKTEN